MGKAIYQPKGKAGEYAAWACNLYVGCSNGCSYCYCKKGVLGSVWKDKPVLKACFKDEAHAFEVFKRELEKHRDKLCRDGLFFSFTTDPLLKETYGLTIACVKHAIEIGVPCSVLTKQAHFLAFEGVRDFLIKPHTKPLAKKHVTFGFTLTGADELEKNANSNAWRIEAMHRLHEMGFRTFASIEPVVDPKKAVSILVQTEDFCDHYKVGLMSGAPDGFYKKDEIQRMYEIFRDSGKDVYFKKSLTDYLGVEPGTNC